MVEDREDLSVGGKMSLVGRTRARLLDDTPFIKEVLAFRHPPVGEEMSLVGRIRAKLREAFGFRYYPFMMSPSQLVVLCEKLARTAGVPGSILEVGCAFGATTVFLNRYIDELGINVDYYAIDTFRGFTPADIEAERKLGRLYRYETCFRGNRKAWFDRTMRRNDVSRVTAFRADATEFDYTEIAPFRLVFIDVDLYRPVLETLRATYDLVSPGGTIIIDDCMQGGEWGGAYDAYIEFTKEKGLEPVITHWLGVITKPGAGA